MTELPWPAHPAAELFPMLNDEELAELADNIRDHGLNQPVWLYDDPVQGVCLLDGRNRARACAMVGARVETRFYRGDDPIGFSISENMHRRHLTTGQRADVALRSLPLYEAEAERRKMAGTRTDLPENQRQRDAPNPVADRPQGSVPDQQKRAPLSRDRAAKTAGTSGRAVARMKRVAEQAPDLAAKVRSGAISLDRAERIIRDREAEQRRIAQARAEAEAQPQPTIVDIRHGDFRNTLADLTGIDAIITDPPYPADYLPLLADLAAWADKALKPDGVMAVLIGQTHLPEVYRLLDGHRPYRWTCCYLTEGPGYVSHPRKIQSNWKPLIIYGGGPRTADVIRSTGADADAKNNHRWGQDYQAFHTLIDRLTTRGQTVADPFTGSGTTLLAAKALGRHAIGCDTDPTAVAAARERLA